MNMNRILQEYRYWRFYIEVIKLKHNKEFMERRIQPKCRKHDSLIIIANGPSLNSMIDKAVSHKNSDYMFVNGGCHLDIFNLIKPLFYVMVDPAYYTRKENQDELHYNDARNDMEVFNRKVSWPISIIRTQKGEPIVPLDKSLVNFLYVSPLVLLPEDELIYLYKRLFDEGYLVPTCQNVTHVAVFSGIVMGYKKIYIYGLDYDIIKNYYIDEKNHLHVSYNHSFGETFDEDISEEGKNMMFQMECGYITYKSFYFDKKLADLNGVRIINCNPMSMIDCFEKEVG